MAWTSSSNTYRIPSANRPQERALSLGSSLARSSGNAAAVTIVTPIATHDKAASQRFCGGCRSSLLKAVTVMT